MRFANKVVIVTGASSGIGAVTAVLLAKEGADVVIVARTKDKLDAVAKQCKSHGKVALVIKADLSKEAEVATVIPKTIEKFGKLDVLINNAGVAVEGCLLDGKALQAYDAVMKINMRAVIQLTMAAAPYLLKTKGNVINISSVVALSVCPGPTNLPYYVSKAALDHFTRCAALELAASGVRVNNVNPGPVANDFLVNNGFENPEALGKGLIDMTAQGFLAKDEDIGGVILFLASDQAKSVTGSSYVVDNGYLLKN